LKEKIPWNLIFQIFWSFFKISPITFGGGYAIIPVIEREVVTKRGWVKEDDISKVLAVSQSAPGAIGVNSAIFIGYQVGGIRGALAAMLGITLPTFIIIILLGMLFLTVQHHPKVEAAFEGMRAAVVALILYAGLKVGKTAVSDLTTLILASSSVLLLLLFNFHPILVIVLGASIGILIVRIKKGFRKRMGN
jgi:chromate transporter